MLSTEYRFEDFGFGSAIIRDLIAKTESVQAFTDRFYDPAGIADMIANRNQFPVNRTVLVNRLKNQNEGIVLSEKSRQNLKSLSEDRTFTITTGHQLNVLTGPLFSIVKIAQTIRIATELKKVHPEFNFVPVFWMATEDHDFEEINHLHLFGKKISWNKTGQDAVIAGRISTSGMEAFFDEIEALYQNDDLKAKLAAMRRMYLDSETLAEATRKLINVLFGESGLVIIDGDDAVLKQQLTPVFQREIQEQITSTQVTATNENLETKGYHLQVHVRACNLFYIHSDFRRERIVYENDVFRFNGQQYAAAELADLVFQNPEKFSPNALLRPVYQELILPNLVYVGGGGEISYWLQLKQVFNALQVSYPLLRVRDSVFVLNQKQADELEKVGISLTDLQKDPELLLKEMVLSQAGDDLNFSDAEAEILKAKSKVLEKVMRVDPGINGLVEAEFSKMISAIEKLEARLVKAEKAKHDAVKNRILKLQDKLFPQGHFQERHENFLTWYLTNPEFLQQVMELVQAGPEPRVRILI